MDPLSTPTGPSTPRLARLAGGLILLAGAAAVFSFVVRWATLTYTTNPIGAATVSVGHRAVGVYLGAFLIVGGIVTLRARTSDTRRAWGTVSAACGLVLAGFAVYDFAKAREGAVSALISATLRSTRFPSRVLRALVSAQARAARFSFRAGIYLALVAAALAVAGWLLIEFGIRGQPPNLR
jgi:hypothetical protein